MLITNNSELAEVCAKVSFCTDLALDTEFARVTSFFPRLSLVQISDGRTSFAVDMLAQMDFTPLETLLQNGEIRKSIHSARQDLEVLYNQFGKNPVNIFDTQIACQFIGFDHPPSYDSIIKFFLGKTLDKKLQFSDWLERPLSQKKLDYALDDVKYLAQVIDKITAELNKLGRLEWVLEECKAIEENTSFTASIEDLLNKIARNFTTPEKLFKALAVLRWREKYARSWNIIRRKVISDEEIALFVNKNILRGRVSKIMSPQVKAAIMEFEPNEQDRQIVERVMRCKDRRKPEKSQRYDELNALLREVAGCERIQASLIASSNELLKYAHGIGHSRNFRFMSGWRYEIFGKLLGCAKFTHL